MVYDMLYLAVIYQANNVEEKDSCLDSVCPKHHSRKINILTRMDEEHVTVAPNINTELC